VTGLVLTAGGARGAYQAGVLKRIGELPGFAGGRSPFPIVTGASAGAINGALIASESDAFPEATRRLARAWSGLQVADVFRTDVWALGSMAVSWVRDLAFGGLIGGGTIQSLLDASPLESFLTRNLNLGRLPDVIRDGALYAVAISATSYHSGRAFTFVQGRPGHPIWRKSRRVCVPVELTLDHIRASASIPLVFAPVPIRAQVGEVYFGDGGLRLVTPLHPAIRLGASRVFAIGVRSPTAAAALARHETLHPRPGLKIAPPPLAQVCGVFMNAIFLDHLDADIDHLQRMNQLIAAYGGFTPPDETGAPTDTHEPMRHVVPLMVSPSEDLALVAEAYASRMPTVVRYVLEGLGTPDAQSADLMSYLLFDSAYTSTLVDIGYADASARIDEIEAFLRADEGRAVQSSVG